MLFTSTTAETARKTPPTARPAFFGIFGTKLFFSTQVSADSPIYGYGVDYLSVVCAASVGLFGQVTMERLMQATGKTTLSMITQLTGAIINIILDPLLILGIGPFPRLEAKGAAIATVIGQIIAFIITAISTCVMLKHSKQIQPTV